MSAKKAPVRKPAAKKTSRSTPKSAPKKVAKTRSGKKSVKVAKKAVKKAVPAKKAPAKKVPVKKATKKTAVKKVAKKVSKKPVAKVTKKVATKTPKAPPQAAKKTSLPSATPKVAAPSPKPSKPPVKKKTSAEPKPSVTQVAPIEKKPTISAKAESQIAAATVITPLEPASQTKEPLPEKEPKAKKPKLPAKKKAKESSPPFSKEVQEALAVTPAVPLEEMPVLVCVQDPHPAPGILTLVEDSDVPAASGIPTQQWRLHAVLEQNPPRFFEGWATTGTFTLDVRVNASVKEKSGNWGGHTTISSGAKPCRLTISIGEDKQVKFSATEGVQHATGKHMPVEARYLIGDIAFTTKEDGIVEVAATSVICTEKWSHLIAHTAAATKGLAFDTRWGAHLKANDGFTVAAGVWTFAVMTRGEYEELRKTKNWPAREIES